MTARLIVRIFCGAALCILGIAGLKVLTIGDWGDDNQNGIIRQERLSVTMSDWCGTHGCDFIVSTGDNFYNDGVFSPQDARFNTSWRHVYDKPHIRHLVWYQSLGNHDYGIIDSRELYQVEFARNEPLWYLPWLWYDFYVTDDNDVTVHFVVVDAMSILLRKHDWEEELRWYEQTLAESTSDWLIVIEHYPPFSAGGYASGSLIHRTYLVALAEQHGVDLFIAGHDHNLQHIAKRGSSHDIDYVISGGGGRGLYEFDPIRGNQTLGGLGFDVKYFGYLNGFIPLDISADTIHCEYVNMEGEIVYSFVRERKSTKRSEKRIYKNKVRQEV